MLFMYNYKRVLRCLCCIFMVLAVLKRHDILSVKSSSKEDYVLKCVH